MFIEMIDLLRCINDHQDSWLVASFRTITNRFVIDGTLGCPICSAEYEISDGVADFGNGNSETSGAGSELSPREREELATRAGAFLNAVEPGAPVILGGSWADAAHELSVMTDSRVLALNPSKRVEDSERVGLLRVGSTMPLAQGAALGAALDASFSADAVASAVRAVRPGGRIVGPVAVTPPGDIAVLARDESYWVAEKPVETISLRRAKITK